MSAEATWLAEDGYDRLYAFCFESGRLAQHWHRRLFGVILQRLEA